MMSSDWNRRMLETELNEEPLVKLMPMLWGVLAQAGLGK